MSAEMLFPGMDPYLEDPQLWPGVHSRLIVYLADQLQPRLGGRYVAAVEERVFVQGPNRPISPDIRVQRQRARPTEEGGAVAVLEETDAPVAVRVPDLEIHENYIEILDRHSGQRVVTVIEVVSPWNKHPGPGRELYLRKQTEVLRSTTHLIEVDLLRTGEHVLAVPEWAARGVQDYDSLVSVNRAEGLRDLYELYPRALRERLPRLRVPLADGDPDVPLNIQAAVNQVYAAGRYRDRIDYDAPCRPPLSDEDRVWAGELIRRKLSDADAGH